jgi:hypothetical protein
MRKVKGTSRKRGGGLSRKRKGGLDKDHVNYIQGPIGLAQDFSRKYNKMIYTFGDLHLHLPDCVFPAKAKVKQIDEYLRDVVISNPDKIIDIFVEATFISELKKDRSNLTEGKGYLAQVMQTWDNCLQVDKTLCPYKNVRMHYVDVRNAAANAIYSQEKLDSDIEVIYNTWDFRNEHFPGKAMDLDDQDSFKLAIDQLAEDAVNYSSQHFKTLQMQAEALKIYTQLNHVKDPKLRQAIENYFLTNGYYKEKVTGEEITQVVKQLRAIDLKKPLDLGDRKAIERLFRKAIYAESWLVDAYAMGRLFRSYENGEETRFAIFYLGDTHVLRYRQFFRLLDFERIATWSFPYTLNASGFEEPTKLDEVRQCVDMSYFQQPFFHDQYSRFIAATAKKVQFIRSGGFDQFYRRNDRHYRISASGNGKVLNPKSNRMIRIGGRVHKTLLREQEKNASRTKKGIVTLKKS